MMMWTVHQASRPQADVGVVHGFNGIDELLATESASRLLQSVYQHHGIDEAFEANEAWLAVGHVFANAFPIQLYRGQFGAIVGGNDLGDDRSFSVVTGSVDESFRADKRD